jgi:DNA polymerase-3 subunit gamma/tau
MLSKSAFNALLKTLEEPPEHVKFLLATTETYKIPETILSRVLRFDLKRMDAGLIAQYLSSICSQEGIVAAAGALSLIAKAADGSIRDSLSILDQAINMSSGNELTAADVREMLNFSNDADVLDLLNLLMNSNVKASIEKYRAIMEAGVSCEKLTSDMLDYIHALTCTKNGVGMMEIVSEELLSKIKEMANGVSLPALSRMWQMLIRGIEELKICDRPEIVLEMMIVRISYASGLPDLRDIINGISSSGSSIIDSESSNKDLESLAEKALGMFPNSVAK